MAYEGSDLHRPLWHSDKVSIWLAMCPFTLCFPSPTWACFLFSDVWQKGLCLMKKLHISNFLFSLNSSPITESTNLLSSADLMTAWRKRTFQVFYNFSSIQVFLCCFHTFINEISSQNSCINASFLPYAHQEALYSGYANVIAKLQNLLVKMSWEICISKKEKSYIAREVYERLALFLCEWLQACPIDFSSHALTLTQLKLSTETQVPKVFFFLEKKKRLSLTSCFSISAPHTCCLRSFFSKERHIKWQSLISPGCTLELSAFLC